MASAPVAVRLEIDPSERPLKRKANCRSLDCDARHRVAMEAKARASSLGMTGCGDARNLTKACAGEAAQAVALRASLLSPPYRAGLNCAAPSALGREFIAGLRS